MDCCWQLRETKWYNSKTSCSPHPLSLSLFYSVKFGVKLLEILLGVRKNQIKQKSDKKVTFNTVHLHLLCCETYNIHDSQDVLLDVPATMVTHHHFVGYHQRLHVTLATNWALKRQLPAADVMWRCLQCPLPPWRTLHRLLIWGESDESDWQWLSLKSVPWPKSRIKAGFGNFY